MRFPNPRLWQVFAVCMLTPLFCAAQEAATSNEVSYVSFQVPGALGTYPMSINNSMTVTGYYYVSATVTGGFLRDADGTVTTFSIRGGLWTEPGSINDGGDITGFYEVVAGIPHGFVRYADGRVVTADPPKGVVTVQAQPISINDFDEVAGNFAYPLSNSAGFTWSRSGVFTTIERSEGASYPTILTGINASGSIVGYCSACYPGQSGSLSFIVHPDGFAIGFAVPVNEKIFIEETAAQSINADEVTAGWYGYCTRSCDDWASGGFVRSPQGLLTTFNPPGTLAEPPWGSVFTDPTGTSVKAPKTLSINLAGAVTGAYTDAAGAQHGFVRNPYGTITSFDPPRGRQTTATGINDGGVIAGWYLYDWNAGIAQGFLRIPKP